MDIGLQRIPGDTGAGISQAIGSPAGISNGDRAEDIHEGLTHVYGGFRGRRY